jgi:hypothetical protein
VDEWASEVPSAFPLSPLPPPLAVAACVNLHRFSKALFSSLEGLAACELNACYVNHRTMR